VNVNKKEAKRLDELVTKLRKKLEFANDVHTSPVEIGNKDLADVLYYLDMLREELSYRVDHHVTDVKSVGQGEADTSGYVQGKLWD